MRWWCGVMVGLLLCGVEAGAQVAKYPNAIYVYPNKFPIPPSTTVGLGREVEAIEGALGPNLDNVAGACIDTSAGLEDALNDETGTGVAVFNTRPTLIVPVLGEYPIGGFPSHGAPGGVLIATGAGAGSCTSTGTASTFCLDTGSAWIPLGGGSGGGVTAHGDLTGLTSGDDHTQYVANAIARTITARHTFNPSSPASPFILGANALGQLVTGLNCDQLGGLSPAQYGRLASGNSWGGSNTFQVVPISILLSADPSGPTNGQIWLIQAGGADELRFRVDGSTWHVATVGGGGQLGGTGHAPDVRGLRETGGPTLLPFGAIPDGTILKRQGGSVVGVTVTGVTSLYVRTSVAIDSLTTSEGTLDTVSLATPTVGSLFHIVDGGSFSAAVGSNSFTYRTRAAGTQLCSATISPGVSGGTTYEYEAWVTIVSVSGTTVGANCLAHLTLTGSGPVVAKGDNRSVASFTWSGSQALTTSSQLSSSTDTLAAVTGQIRQEN